MYMSALQSNISRHVAVCCYFTVYALVIETLAHTEASKGVQLCFRRPYSLAAIFVF